MHPHLTLANSNVLALGLKTRFGFDTVGFGSCVCSGLEFDPGLARRRREEGLPPSDIESPSGQARWLRGTHEEAERSMGKVVGSRAQRERGRRERKIDTRRNTHTHTLLVTTYLLLHKCLGTQASKIHRGICSSSS